MLLNSYNINAGIREDLQTANEAFIALKSTSDNWKTVAQQFINVFDTLNNKLIGIAEANGGKNDSNSFIDPIQWKDGRIVCEICVQLFTTYYNGSDTDQKKYFKHNIARPLMAEICKEVNGVDAKTVAELKKKIEKKGKTLTTKDLKKLKSKNFKKELAMAGEFWINNFVKPVGVLLKTYSLKENNSVEELQLLLNLWRCYRSCQMVTTIEPSAWATNFKEAYAAFGSYLAFTITTCKEDEESKKEICCDLLNQDPTTTINNPEAGCEKKYNFTTEDLVNWIGTKKPVCKEIEEALGNAKKIVAYWDNLRNAYEQGREFGFGTRMGFGY